jgi:hypothetical protein
MTSQTIFRAVVLFVILLIFAACKPTPPAAQQTPAATPQPSATIASATPQPSKDEGKSAEDFLTKEEKLLYNGYEITKRKRMDKEDMRSTSRQVEVNYAEVRRGKRLIARFDDALPGIMHSIDFGFFPFFGGDSKQLLVSYSEFRGGRQWVVELVPTYREIFDTGDWGVGRESADLSFIDIDKDGVWEIQAAEFWYYVFNELSMSETPVVDVLFKYDANTKKYLPANHFFREYSLRGIEDQINSLPAQEGHGYLGRRVDVLLMYLYAGKEKEGWAFFERTYEAKGKAQIKARIRTVLKNSAVYQYVRKHQKN